MKSDLVMNQANWPLACVLPMRKPIMRICWCLLHVVLLLGLTKAQAAVDEPLAEGARAQFAHGIELADQGDYQGALQAFSAAYSASPHFAVLYNIGQAQVALGRPLEAVATLSRYLREGQDNVQPERRREVEEQIKLLESFLVELDVTTDRSGATITVDGREAGRTPLAEPVRLTAGSHKITAGLDGSATASSVASQQPEVCPPLLNPPPILEARPAAQPVPVRSGLRRALPYALAGTGVALGAGALGIYLWKRGEYERWQTGATALQSLTPGSVSYQARATDNQRMAASLTTANHAILGLAIAGGALVAAGGSLYFLDWRSARKSGTFTVAWAGGSSVAAGWRCAW